MKEILETPVSTPKEMLYLEMGVIPIRYIIKMRRLNFLQYILHEDKNSLVHSCLTAQLENPSPGDWGLSCLKDLEELDIKWNISDIENMSKSSFRNIVRKKTAARTLDYLNEVKGRHSKVLHIPHMKLKLQEYLETRNLSVQETKFLFALRSRMINVKVNYREKHIDMLCPCCKMEDDSQEHLLSCSGIKADGILASSVPVYQDLFGNNIEKQVNLARILKKRFEQRKSAP